MKNKIPIFSKRVLALALVVMTLLSVFTISASAGDSAFMETLINTEKYVYTANFTSDTKNKANKYAYKYMNMAYVLNDACGVGSLDNQTSQRNPNYCFRLDADHVNGNYSYSKKKNGSSLAGSDKNLNLFLLLEGYYDEKTGTIITDDNHISNAASAKEKQIMKTKKSKTTSPLSYPGYYTETVTSQQSEYAQSTLIHLVAGLNGILSTVNDGKRFTSVSELVNKSILIRPSDTKNVTILKPQPNASGDYQGYVIFYADLTNVSGYGSLVKETSAGQANRTLSDMTPTVSYNSDNSSSSFLNVNNLPRASIENGLYCYIFPIESFSGSTYTLNANKASIFVYAMPKGFTEIYDSSNTLFSPVLFTKTGGEKYDYVDNQGDVPWISIHMLSMYANLVYKQHGQSVSTYVEPDTNIFSKMISSIFNGILWVIRSVLGLSEIDTLVFNLGSRGSASYNFGLMSENWWNVVLQYQLIFQAIAWVILVCGFIKTLIDLNLSTINPQKRAHLYEVIKKFIVVGIGLVILIPCVQFLLECNDTIVELFASQVETSSLNMPQVNNVLVQFIVGMCWMTIMLYINFIYIMRSITVALLISSGPFFISTVAFDQHGRSTLFISWFKELLANIFVQSIHAFVLSFLVQLLVSGTFLETFAIAISIIPITEMFRSLVFGGAGATTSQMASVATSTVNKTGNAMARGIASGTAKAIGAGDGGNDGGSGGGGFGGPGGGGNRQSDARSIIDQRKSAKLERMSQGTSIGGQIKARSEQKTGKEGGSVFAKIGGTAVDIAGLAGMEAIAGMEAFADFSEGLADVQLKGEAAGLGRAVEKHTGSAIQSSAAMGHSIAKADQHKQNRQKTSSKDLKTNTSKASHMGQAAITATKGMNANGAKIKTKAGKENQTVFAPINDKSPKVQDISDQSGEQIASAIHDFEYGTEQKQSRILTKNASGGYSAGTKYSYKDKEGQDRSFFVSDKSENNAIPYRSTATAAPAPESAPMVSYGEGKEIAKTNDAHSAMVQTHSTNVKEEFKGYTDANGKSIGTVREDKGRLFADFNRSASEASEIIEKYTNDQQKTKDGAVFEQTTGEFVKEIIAERNGNGELLSTLPKNSGGEYDFGSHKNSGDYTNAALISVLGKEVEGSAGVYQLGNEKFHTGLSKEDAAPILAARGISGARLENNNVVYHQHTPKDQNNTFVAAQTFGGKTISKFNADIGTPNGPSWKSDGSGGGEMKFANKKSAMDYFQKHGAAQMADYIGNGANGTNVHDFKEAANGEFVVNFRGKDLAMNGMRMEQHSDGKSLMVSTSDSRVADPFAIDSDLSTTRLDNQPDVDSILPQDVVNSESPTISENQPN